MSRNDIIWQESELKNIINFVKDGRISLDDINSFLHPIIRNASVRTKTSYEEITKRNNDFFNYLANIFKNTERISIYSEDFKTLCSMIKVPVIKNNLRSEEKMMLDSPTKKGTDISHLDCLNMFENLSLKEKIAFVKALQDVKIELSPSELLKLNME